MKHEILPTRSPFSRSTLDHLSKVSFASTDGEQPSWTKKVPYDAGCALQLGTTVTGRNSHDMKRCKIEMIANLRNQTSGSPNHKNPVVPDCIKPLCILNLGFGSRTTLWNHEFDHGRYEPLILDSRIRLSCYCHVVWEISAFHPWHSLFMA